MRKQNVKALKGKKGYLQTVGMICQEHEYEELTERFIRAGLTHIVHGVHMSHTEADATHDGEYPLRRYSRIIQIEKGNT